MKAFSLASAKTDFSLCFSIKKVNVMQEMLDYTNALGLLHLLPADQVVATAALGAASPEWQQRRNAGFPASMALAAMAYEQELKSAMRQAGFGQGMHVLDAACGPGMGSRYLLDVGVEEVTGYDINPAMLHLARQLHSDASTAQRLRFQSGDLNTPLPFADNSFDGAWLGDIWMPQALPEIRRVTRPGGLIVLKLTGIAAGITYLWDLDLQARVEAALRKGSPLLFYPSVEGDVAKQSFYEQFLRSGQWQQTRIWTTTIERVAPVPSIFEMDMLQWFGLWAGAILKDHADPEDWQRLSQLYDNRSPHYLFHRPDAYFVQTLTLCCGRVVKE